MKEETKTELTVKHTCYWDECEKEYVPDGNFEFFCSLEHKKLYAAKHYPPLKGKRSIKEIREGLLAIGKRVGPAKETPEYYHPEFWNK